MQKAFEKIIKTLEKLRINSINEECPVVPDSEDCEAEQCCASCFLTKAIKIVNQVAEEYAADTGNAAITAWETVYKQILKLEKEYFEAGDVKNSDELIKLQNLLRHYKEQLTEEAGSNLTNGDKIRSMTDKELAEVILCPYDTAGTPEDIMPCVTETGTQKPVSPECCKKCMTNWLERECS